MRLWGRKTSVNVQKVLWALEELSLDYERLDAGGAFGGLDDPAYLAMNPMRKVPTLVDGDLVIWESNAVVRYLARAYGDTLGGRDAVEAGRADMWMEWFQNNPYPQFIALFYQLVRLPRAERDAAKRDHAIKVVSENFTILDRHLSDRDFVAGEAFTMGDIPVGSALYRYYTLDFDRPDLPALAAYYDRLSQRAAYRETVMMSYDSLRAPEA
ncbi:glutathione S-transferase family protein [Marinovum sp.]|uniref:glutathione S-transferase family protein n=1 Tax=Marinovum sp. TaxID=2024839 RepID=UPI003A91F243